MQSSPRFRPFETSLDEGHALAILREATAGADDGELFLERRRGESLVFDDGRLKNAAYDAAEGFGLRAVQRRDRRLRPFDRDLRGSAEARRRDGAARGRRRRRQAGGGAAADQPRLYTDRDPFDDAEFAVKVEMLRAIDAYVRGLDPRVVQVSAALGASMQEVEILRPDGTRLAEARPMVRLNVSVIVEQNGRARVGLGRRRRPARAVAADAQRPLAGGGARRCASAR